MASLFEKIGGHEAVKDAVDFFYEKVLADHDLTEFFYYTDMAAQHVKQQLFLTMAFGGPNQYTGENLRRAHAPLIEKGLNEKHFNLVASYLRETLEDMKVSPELIQEVLNIVAAQKDNILNR